RAGAAAGAVAAPVAGDVAGRCADLRRAAGDRVAACRRRRAGYPDVPPAEQEPGRTSMIRIASAVAAKALALAAMLIALPALAQDDPKAALAKLKPKDFPTQPIEYTVVYPAGGGLDVTARLLAKFVEKWSGDRIIVNNRTGGAGMVGHTYLATQAKPDGYTVGVLASLVWGDAMLRAQGKWSISDLEPIGYLNTDALTWVSSTEGPYKGMSVKQLVQAAK